MADAVEIINGVGSMYSFREPAWHGLGTCLLYTSPSPRDS